MNVLNIGKCGQLPLLVESLSIHSTDPDSIPPDCINFYRAEKGRFDLGFF